ncbi:hypothetical protein F5888DRAFT_1182452 [Russula emetica]|nr:hypothetical protein F5888DRAFT_1182452 [Russula emetica]
MTRGRRKDTTLPPSRPLIIQRAYRDRKAKYLSDLEDRCRKAEEENERLRNELELARSESATSIVNSELARVCSDLMQNLEQTQKVLSLFQRRVLGTPQEQSESERVIPSATELDIAAILTHTLRQDPSAPTSQAAQLENTHQSTVSVFDATVGDDDGQECCGGIINCEGLIE